MDPITMSLIASAAAGTATSMTGGLMGGKVSKLGYDLEAAKAYQAAEEVEKQWGYESWRHDLAMRRTLGSQRASFGDIGIDLSGSAIDDLAESAKMMTLDKLMAGRSARIAADQHRTDARFYKLSGKAAKKTGLLNAGTSFFGGASDILSASKSTKASKKQGG